jgi:hypothetical protein
LRPQQLNIAGGQKLDPTAPPYAFRVVGVEVLNRLIVSELNAYRSAGSATVLTRSKRRKTNAR